MRCRLSAGLGLLMSIQGAGGAERDSLNPVADDRAIVVAGNARFTVLTPRMIRMEWSSAGRFEDRASLVFVNRHLPVPEFAQERDGEWVVLKTPCLTLRYREDAGRFDAQNVSIELMLNGERVVWRPGTADTGNLKGTFRTLDAISGGVPLGDGLLSRNGWVVVDDSNRPLFDAVPGSDLPWAVAREEDAIDWYFLGYGHDYAEALRDFTSVAGRIPLPPRYAFGAWWSRYWAYTADELKKLVGEFQQNDVPLDVLVIDMDWHLEGWTGYTWNPEYFADPEGFLRWAHEEGLKVSLNLHPADGVKQHERAFAEVARHMGLDPEDVEHVPFDCTDPRYMEAYFRYLHHPLERQGVDFWWIDWQQGESTTIQGLDPLFWVNHLHWTDMKRNPERKGLRPILLSRWGGLGNHRYQVGFSGDTHCNWASLVFQPFFTSTAGNACYPFWSHDIGGHQPGPVEPELYARWIQWGALSPILRSHTTKSPKAERRIWAFPDEVARAAKEAFELRYALIPYIYTAARQCHDAALPLCRPLYYEWPELDEAYEHGDQYLFGDQLLVAPVIRPIRPVSGCAQVRVWIPPGSWTHWFSGKTYEGPRVASLLVPLEEIPMFVRGGGVIPTQPKMSHVGQAAVDPLVIHVWPGEAGEARIYEDDGLTLRYQNGQAAWTPVSHKLVDGARRITIGPVEGAYPGMLTERQYEIRLRDVAAERVEINGAQQELLDAPRATGCWYDAHTFSTVIRLPRARVDQEQVVAVSPLPMPNGLRGAHRLLREILGWVVHHTPIDAEAGRLRELEAYRQRLYVLEQPSALRENLGASLVDEVARGCLRVIPSLSVGAEDARQRIVRLLGIFADLRAAAGRSDEELSVSLDIGFSPVMKDLAGYEATLTLSAPAHWEIRGETRWHWPALSVENPNTVETTLRARGAPQTAILSAELAVRWADSAVRVPLESVLLPSINRWWVIGPFDADFRTSLERVFPPEEGIDLDADYAREDGSRITWRKVERPMTAGADLTGEFLIDFHELFGAGHDAVAYALVWLRAEKETEVTLAIGTDDGTAIWLNGDEIHRHHVGRAYTSKEERVPLALKRGSNALLVKVTQSGGSWLMAAHVEGADGNPVPQVTAHLTPEGGTAR